MNLALVSRLAARNLSRNLRRTAITAAAVVISVALLIVGFGLVDGLDENVIRAQQDAVSSHVLLRPVAYPDNGLSFPIDRAAVIPPPLRQHLDEDRRIDAWTARLWFSARLID
ncbi:MAG: hypothetical protein AAFV53_34695, partial [Myxococcota bacterium]